MNKLLIILGSTSTGKTDLALNLARKFDGELVSCDSRQVYKGLDIGTGKLPSGKWKVKSEKLKKQNGYWEMDGIKVWMYDVVEADKQYSVADYVRDACSAIDKILTRRKLPIIVGGTGFYLKALLEGLPNLVIPLDLKLRQELSQLSLDQLQKRLQKISSPRWEKMNNSDKQNPRRLIRAIEIACTVDKNATAVSSLLIPLLDKSKSGILKIGLIAAREILYQRIDKRVISRVNQGMIEEAINLHKNGLSFRRMRQLGLEYGELADYLEGKINSKNDLIKILQGKIHGYARRQITWFKREKSVKWFDISDKNFPDDVEKMVTKWYYQGVNAAKN